MKLSKKTQQFGQIDLTQGLYSPQQRDFDYRSAAAEEIQKYDQGETQPDYTGPQLSYGESVMQDQQQAQEQAQQEDAYYRNLANMAAIQEDPFYQREVGPAPGQVGLDPESIYGGFGQEVSRSLQAGFGDLYTGTGEAVDFVASLFPGGDDDNIDTNVGNWFRKQGEKLQNENFIAISRDLEDVTFRDMFNPEMWSTKIARLLPYAASMFIPFGAGVKLTNVALKGFNGYLKGKGAIKGAQGVRRIFDKQTGKFVRTDVVKGSGLTGWAIKQAAKDGKLLAPELTSAVKSTSRLIGGSTAAGLVETTYVAGEARNQALSEGFDEETANQIAYETWKTALPGTVAFDIVSFGILFGGTRFAPGMFRIPRLGPKPLAFGQQAAWLATNTGYKVTALGSIEGFTEGLQESWQEWAKERSIAKQKGNDFMSYSEYVQTIKDRPESRDIFWSSFGSGFLFGGARGIFDGWADLHYWNDERATRLNKRLDSIKDAITQADIDNQQLGAIFDVYRDYRGSESLDQHMDKLMNNGQLTEEKRSQIETIIKKIDDSVLMYLDNDNITEAGKDLILEEIYERTLNEIQIDNVNASREEELKTNEATYTEKEELQKANDETNKNADDLINALEVQNKKHNNNIKNIYTNKKVKYTKGGLPKRSSVGLTKEESAAYTTPGRQEAGLPLGEEYGKPPTLIERVREGVGKAVEAVKGAAKTVGQTIRETVTPENLQAIKDNIAKGANWTAKQTKESLAKVDSIIQEEVNKGREGNLSNKEISTNVLNRLRKETAGVTTPIANAIKSFVESKIKGTKQTFSSLVTGKEVTEQTQEKTIDELATQPTDPVKKETYETTNENGNKITVEIITAKDGSRQVTYKDKGGAYLTDTFKKDNTLTNEEIVEKNITGSKKAGITKTETIEGFENIANPKSVARRKKELADKKETQKKKKIDKKSRKVNKKTSKDKKILSETKISEEEKDTKKKPWYKKFIKNPFKKYKKSDTLQEGADMFDTSEWLKQKRFGKDYIRSLSKKALQNMGANVIILDKIFDDRGNEVAAYEMPLGMLRYVVSNPKEALNTAIVHEGGHIIYETNKDNPVIQRMIASMLKDIPQSEWNKVIQTYATEYKIKLQDGSIITLEELYLANLELIDRGKLKDIVLRGKILNLQSVEKDPTAFNLQLMELGNYYRQSEGASLVDLKNQDIIISEMFVKTLEENAGEGLYSIIPKSKERKKYERYLDRYYSLLKKSNLSETESKELLDEAHPEVKNMNYQQAAKWIIRNYGTFKVPSIKNNQSSFNRKQYKRIQPLEDGGNLLSLDIATIMLTKDFSGITEELAVNQILKDLLEKNNPELAKKFNTSRPKETWPTQVPTYDYAYSIVRAYTIAKLRLSKYNSLLDKNKKEIIQLLDKAKAKKFTSKDDLKLAEALLDGLSFTQVKTDTDGNVESLNDQVLDELVENFPEFFGEQSQKIGDKNRVIGETTSQFINNFILFKSFNTRGKLDKRLRKSVLLSKLVELGFNINKNPMVRKQPYAWVLAVKNEARKGKINEVTEFVKYLNEIFTDAQGNVLEGYVDKALLDMSVDFLGKHIEHFKKGRFQVQVDPKDGQGKSSKWTISEDVLSRDETSYVSALYKFIQNNEQNQEDGRKFLRSSGYQFGRPNLDRGQAMNFVFKLLADSNISSYIDFEANINRRLTYSGGSKIGYIDEVVNNTKWYRGDGSINMSFVNRLLKDLIIGSRGQNWFVQIDNVKGDPTLLVNNENPLLNRLLELSKIRDSRMAKAKKDILIPDEKNIYAALIASGIDLSTNIFSGVYKYYVGLPNKVKDENKSAISYKHMSKQELAFAEFGEFLSFFNDFNSKKARKSATNSPYQGEELFYYEQSIMTFGNASRRYRVKSVMAHTPQSIDFLLNFIKNGKYLNKKYKDGSYVISRNFGEQVKLKTKKTKNGTRLVFANIEEDVQNFVNELININPSYIKGNSALQVYFEVDNKTNKVKFRKGKENAFKEVAAYYITSYRANRVMAQDLFIGDHSQHKNEGDYVTRGKGAIARMKAPLDPIEVVVYEDIYEDNNDINVYYTEEEAKTKYGKDWQNKVSIATDAGAVTTEKFAESINHIYGDMNQVGAFFKFVGSGIETNNSNILGERAYLKKAVSTISKKQIDKSPYYRKLNEVIEERARRIEEVSGKQHLVFAMPKSAAKVYFKKAPIHNIINDDINTINDKQEKIYFLGDKKGVYTKFQGTNIDYGIQLLMDKEKNERSISTQLFTNIYSNAVTEQDQALIKSLGEQINIISDLQGKERVGKQFITNRVSSSLERNRDQNYMNRFVLENFFSVLSTSFSKYGHYGHPSLTRIYDMMGASLISKNYAKLETPGTIAYQVSSAGLGLKSYTKADGYYKNNNFIEGYEGENKFKNAIDKLRTSNPNLKISEAWVPHYIKKMGYDIGDVFLATRIPAHGKPSHVVMVIRDFHEEHNFNSKSVPNSIISVGTKVTKILGSDFDGDGIHMNFKFKKDNTELNKAVNTYMDMLFDLYSRDAFQNEIESDIEYKSESIQNILNSMYKNKEINKSQFNKLKEQGKLPSRKHNQLDPLGDMEYFQDNVPAGNLIGVAVSLDKILKLFSFYKVGFDFNIIINNSNPIGNFYDDPTANNNIGNWIGTALLENQIMDNVKDQLANRLGINANTLYAFGILRRLGFSEKDLAIIFNSPAAKLYNDSQADVNISTGFNDKAKQAGTVKAHMALSALLGKISNKENSENIIKSYYNQDINVNINTADIYKRGKLNADMQFEILKMLHKLERVGNQAMHVVKSLSISKKLPWHPFVAQKWIDAINGIDEFAGDKSILTNLEPFRQDPLVQFSLNTLQRIVDRHKSRNIMYTPEAKNVISKLEDIGIKLDFENNLSHRNVLNSYVLAKYRRGLSLLQPLGTQVQLIRELKEIAKNNSNNLIFSEVLDLETGKVKETNNDIVLLNPTFVNEHTMETELMSWRKDFDKLDARTQKILFQLDFVQNGMGYARKSFAGIFSETFQEKVNNEIDEILNEELARDENEFSGQEEELIEDIINSKHFPTNKDIFKKSKIKKDSPLSEIIKNISRSSKSYKRINDEFYGEGPMKSKKEWIESLGYVYDDLKKNNPKYFKSLEDRYENEYKAAEELSEYIEEDFVKAGKFQAKKNGKYVISTDKLYDYVVDIEKLDPVAGGKAKESILQEIARRTFDEQIKFLKGKVPSYIPPKYRGQPGEHDISMVRKWFGSNNMTAKRPEIQSFINQIEDAFYRYVKEIRRYDAEINNLDRKLRSEKNKQLTSVTQRAKYGFLDFSNISTQQRNEFYYGKFIRKDATGLKLVTEQQLLKNNPSKTEIQYYNLFKNITGHFQEVIKNKTPNFKGREYYIPHTTMGPLEALSARGLYGLYSVMVGSTSDIDNIKVEAINPVTNNTVIKSFSQWNQLYHYLLDNNQIDNVKATKDINKIRRTANKFRKTGRNADGSKIELSVIEENSLREGTIFNRFTAHRGTKNTLMPSFDLTRALKEYVRATLFVQGNRLYSKDSYKAGLRSSLSDDERFEGFEKIQILLDSIITFNKGLGNENAVEYLDKWWKQGFLLKRKQKIFGVADNIINGFVRLTALNVLGLNWKIGIGNALIGKYQELRKRPFMNFKKGEFRFWKDYKKSQRILKENRIIEFSFKDVFGQNMTKLEEMAFMFMDMSEKWVQGSAYLGMLTEEEFKTEEITIDRNREINHKIATLHGEGYTPLDQRLLSMYSLGSAAQQFKRWFITLLFDRLQQGDIDRFGNQIEGSYRTSGKVGYKFINILYNDGTKAANDYLKELSPEQQSGVRSVVAGMGMGSMVLLLSAMLADDDDPAMKSVAKTLQKMSSDIFVLTDAERFVNYTIPPAAYGTFKNTLLFTKDLVTLEKYPEGSRYEGIKFPRSALQVVPTGESISTLVSKY